MRVLQINATCGVGSTGKIAVDIGCVLKERKNESYIAYGYYDTAEDNTLKLKRGKTKYSLYMELMRCRLTGYYGFTSKRATKKLIQWIEEIKPDIIQLHNIHGGFLHIEILFDYLSKKNIPIVWTLHDCWSFTGHCTHFLLAGCDKWKSGCYECPVKDGYPKRYFFDRSKEQYERKKKAFTSVKNMTFITPSEWLKSLVKESFFKQYPVYALNNGINLSLFKPTENNIKEKLGISDKKMVLGVQMGWSKQKGWQYIIELSKLLKDDYKIVLIGVKSEQLKELPENVIGLTCTENQGVLAQFYTAADVFINTSLVETFSTVNLEALACGTPVVTFDSGGCRETVNDKCGRVVKPRDVNAMVNAVEEIVSADTFDECINWSRNFDMHDKFVEYINLYDNVLRGKK